MSPFLALPVLAFQRLREGELTVAQCDRYDTPSCEVSHMQGDQTEVHGTGLKIKVGHSGNLGQTDTWPPVSGNFSHSLGLCGAPVLSVPTALLWLSLSHADDTLTRHSNVSWLHTYNVARVGQVLWGLVLLHLG